MAKKFPTLDEVIQLYQDAIWATHSQEKTAKRIINETLSAINRLLLPVLGFKRSDHGRKMTAAETQAAQEYTSTVTVLRLRKSGELLEKALNSREMSISTRNTYGNRLKQFLSWIAQQSWTPSERVLRTQHECCPPRRVSGRRRIGELALTSRTGSYTQYALKPEDTPAELQKTLDDLERFMIAPHYPGRVLNPIKESTRDTYLRDIRLMLGFCIRHQKDPIPLEKLTLQDLIPLVSPRALQGLSDLERDEFWRSKELALQAWLYEYFTFIHEENCSTSPSTQLAKLTALKRVANYLYRHQVRCTRDYQTIPIFIALDNEISKAVKVKKRWQKTRTYVANQEHKWITPVPNETVLTTLRRELLEVMRLGCRPRRPDGVLREPKVIARSILHYLKWVFLLDFPPRRQVAYRTTQIALTCPIRKPDDVPADGCYFPLPPPQEREKNHDGTSKDNYLYKVYTYKGEFHPQGLWVLELTSYKTDETYGIYSMVLPDRTFDDGTSFYQTLEHYLCGWWMPESKQELPFYDWWDSELSGQRGRWITKGRADFEPQDRRANTHRQPNSIWRSGYLFPNPMNGKPADGNAFGGSFSRTSYQILGKRITPHMLRYVWATWAFQVQLTDAELQSLAYAMGHSVETLRRMYERCTPEEKLRPIFEAIDRHLFQQLEVPPGGVSPSAAGTEPQVMAVVNSFLQLSPEDQQEVLRLLKAA